MLRYEVYKDDVAFDLPRNGPSVAQRREETAEMEWAASTFRSAPSRRIGVGMLSEIANRRGLPLARLALAWVLQEPAVTAPIVGATKPHHLEDAVGALSVKLSDEEIKALEEPYVPHALVGFE